MDFNRILSGMISAARLDVPFYDKVEHDVSYTNDARAVVVLVAILGGIGTFLGSLRNIGGAIVGLLLGVVVGVAMFYLWAFLVHFVGTRLFKGTGDFGEVERCLGFAYSPRILALLSFVPCVGGLVGLAAWLWLIATGFIAVREALDLDNTNAALTMVIATVIVVIVSAVIGVIALAAGIAGLALTGAQ
jgi:hypothetical protein